MTCCVRNKLLSVSGPALLLERCLYVLLRPHFLVVLSCIVCIYIYFTFSIKIGLLFNSTEYRDDNDVARCVNRKRDVNTKTSPLSFSSVTTYPRGLTLGLSYRRLIRKSHTVWSET